MKKVLLLTLLLSFTYGCKSTNTVGCDAYGNVKTNKKSLRCEK